jgi:plasmid stabilization system protein ParE
MTAQPHEPPPRPPLPERNAAAIYAALRNVNPAAAEQFDEQWRDELERARDTRDLTVVQRVIEGWWRRTAFEVTDPVGHRAAMDRARRRAAGEDVPTLTWEQILARRGA